MEVRPVFHWRPDRVRNHVRLCFIAYWLCAKLALEWRVKGEKGEVQSRFLAILPFLRGLTPHESRILEPFMLRAYCTVKRTCSGWPNHGTWPRGCQSFSPDFAMKFLFGPKTVFDQMPVGQLNLNSRFRPALP